MKKRLLQLSCALFACLGINSACYADVEVRMMTPPQLEESNQLEKVLCHRPMRRGAPKMALEELEGKVVVHDYGHGGSGWTLAPGVAEYCVTMYQQYLDKATQGQWSKDTPVTVLGAGVIGLFTALELTERGFTQVTVIADRFEDLTSHKAGGLIAPVSMDNDPELQKVVDEIGIKAYLFFKKIAQGEHPLFVSGAKIMPSYFANREESGLEPYVSAGVMQSAKDVILDFQNGKQQTMVAYDDGIFTNPRDMMTQLRSILETRNVQFAQRHISSFDEIETKVVFNCAGLDASQLTSDEALVSVQGHLILLKNQNPEDLQYMALIYPDVTVNELGQTVKSMFYMFPKIVNDEPGSIGVIGGTIIEGATEETPNKEQFEKIWKSARQFYGLDQ